MKNLDDLLETETDQHLLRLFAVGCCRHIWDLLKDDRSRTAVEVAERFACGQATLEELDAAFSAARAAAFNAARAAAFNAASAAAFNAASAAAFNAASAAAFDAASAAAFDAARAATFDAARAATRAAAWDTAYVSNAARAVANAAATDADYWAVHAAAREKQLDLYNCIFTKIAFTTTNQNVFNLAKIIYEGRQWSLMPILGDALEEDGCPEEIISHCKETEHARGCWVVDNILRKG